MQHPRLERFYCARLRKCSVFHEERLRESFAVRCILIYNAVSQMMRVHLTEPCRRIVARIGTGIGTRAANSFEETRCLLLDLVTKESSGPLRLFG